MHDGKMVISSFDHVRNWRLMLFIRLNKTATNVENGRSERTTVPVPLNTDMLYVGILFGLNTLVRLGTAMFHVCWYFIRS